MSSPELPPPPVPNSNQDATTNEVSSHETSSVVDTSDEPSAVEVVVGPAITWKTWLYKRVRGIQQGLLNLYQKARKPICVTPQYSPIRFTTGLSPVILHCNGWGLCVYGTKIRKFNDSILRITVPINEEATIFLVGWGQLLKYSLYVASSIQHVEDFSISTDQITAQASLPKIQVPAISHSPSLPKITVRIPQSPSIEVNQAELTILREYLREES